MALNRNSPSAAARGGGYVETDGVALPEPNPANKEQRAFSWITVCKFVPDRPAP
jgi:hypothetical protein